MNSVNFPIVSYPCQVLEITSLSANTFQVDLASPAGTTLEYHAGQHLQLELDINDDGQPQTLFYSIANGFNPDQPRHLQLFIQNNSELADRILRCLSKLRDHNTAVKVTLPMGKAFLQTDLRLPHLLIAAGSGIAKIKCLTEEILRQRPDANVNIYWSNKHIDDFYLIEQFQAWVKQHKNLNFTPILESPAPEWHGRSGYIYKVIEEDFNDLSNDQIYLCGSPQMVYGTMDKLNAIGLKEENCYSDVFEYAPKEDKVTS